MLWVCRRWYHALLPLVWSTVSVYQWHHPSFPIRPLVTPSKDPALLPYLSLIRHIFWADNILVSSTTPATKPLKTIARQMSASRFAWLLHNSPNLATLSLRRYCSGFDPVFYHAVAAMPNLKSLCIHAPSHKTRIPIEDMFPLFARLEELHIAGFWYNQEGLTGSRFLNSIKTTPWRLKKLKCNRPDWALALYCPDLTFFEILSTEPFSTPLAISLRFLLAFPKLETVKLPYKAGRDSFTDLIYTLQSLKALRSLTFNICRKEELEFLCSPYFDSQITYTMQNEDPTSNQARKGQGLLSLPLLEYLHIHHINLRDNYEACFRMLHNILVTRVNLKSFQVNREILNPTYMFARPGQEARDDWGCKGLESLVFSMAKSMYLRTAEEDWAYWQPIYRQLGQLSRLESIEIKCSKVQVDKNSGILQLSGAKNLKRLVLRGTESVKWTRKEVLDLLMVLPKLEILQVKPLKKGFFLKIKAWLCEAGRADVAFNEESDHEPSEEDIIRLERSRVHYRRESKRARFMLRRG
ncbi:hypothetical protein BGW39_008504 [Mortierella sp. 14UC]|nr:hypothetical protein BGW39_008504 [Mortierella sp. 14UC]